MTTLLAAIPAQSDWVRWQDRIRTVLGLPSGIPILDAEIPRPWFLVPVADELSEGEAEELFAAIRRELFAHDLAPAIGDVISRLRGLTVEESLPLLYAMRHVARTDGGSGYYWPAFRKQILDDRIELLAVQTRLAPLLADLWVRLYTYSRFALYSPSEGRRNIKWPLVHAGLLPADEEALHSFGRFLRDAYGADPAALPLTPDDLDQFLLLFSLWFQADPPASQGHLAHLLRPKSGTVAIIGELAQRRLRDLWPDIVANKVVPAEHRQTLPRPRLRYDAAENQLQFRLQAGSWPGRVTAQLDWNGRRTYLITYYLPAEDRTEYEAFTLPLHEPDWPITAHLLIDEQPYPLAVPRSPGADSGLVFEADTGRHTRQWHLGDAYAILIPRALFAAELAGTLFSEYEIHGSPEGGWQEFVLLSGTIDDPLDPDTASDDITRAVLRLEEVTDKLGLPNFSQLWRPRLRLVGGDRLLSSAAEPTFSLLDRPYVEVDGLWRTPLNLSLARSGHRDEIISRIRLNPRLSSEPVLIDPWPVGVAAAGTFEFRLGDAPAQLIQLVDAPPEPALDCFSVGIGVERAQQRLDCAELALNDLERGSLIALAWPFAQLRLTITGGGHLRRLPLDAGPQGQVALPWSDLGFKPLESGSLRVVVSWRGLLTSTQHFAALPYVDPAKSAIRITKLASGRAFSLRGVVRLLDSARQGRIIALGERPWAGEIAQCTFPVAQDGSFSVDLPLGACNPGHIIVGPANLHSAKRPWLLAAASATTSSAPADRAAFEGADWDMWTTLAVYLRQSALPPRLHTLVTLAPLGRFLQVSPEFGSDQPRWRTIDTSVQVSRLAGLLRLGVQPPLVVIEQRLWGTRLLAPRPPFLTPRSRDTLTAALDSAHEAVPLSCTRPSAAGWVTAPRAANWVASRLRIAIDGDRCDMVIDAYEDLIICARCGLILPRHEFEHHHSPFSGTKTCMAESPGLSPINRGQSRRVHIAASFDPSAILRALCEVPLRTLDDWDPPVSSHVWLDQLGTIYDRQESDSDPRAWLSTLRDTALALWPLVANTAVTRPSPSDLAVLSAHVERYYDALLVIFRWLHAELGEVDAALS